MNNPARVLIIDDSVANIRLLAGILRDLADISFATKGEQGIGMASDSLPDLILLDVELPDGKGYDFCRRLKSTPGTEPIPVLFISANIGEAHEVAALEAGGMDVISKPFNPPLVRRRVQTILEWSRWGKIHHEECAFPDRA